LLESFRRLGDLTVEKRVYVMHRLSPQARKMLEVLQIKLFDREEMWKHVWPAEVKVYATDVNIKWITKV
jgi:hypothetical protein